MQTIIMTQLHNSTLRELNIKLKIKIPLKRIKWLSRTTHRLLSKAAETKTTKTCMCPERSEHTYEVKFVQPRGPR